MEIKVGETNETLVPGDNELVPDGDNEVETPVDTGDTETETPEEEEPSRSVFEELELNKTYENEEAALRALREKERTLTQAQMDAAEMRRLLAQVIDKEKREEVKKPSREELEENFQVDPIGTIDQRAGYVADDKVEGLRRQIATIETERHFSRLSRSMRDIDDLKNVAEYMENNLSVPPRGMNQAWDKLSDFYGQTPGLHGADPALLIPMLYNQIFGGKAAVSKAEVTPVPPAKKEKAQTHAGRQKTSPGGMPDFNKMTAAQVKEWAIKNGYA
jgi:hypothetical protein